MAQSDHDTAAPHTRVWYDGKLAATDVSLAEVRDHINRGGIAWIDVVHDPGQRDIPLLSAIAENLDIDAYAVEDAVNRHERAKVDVYARYLFLNCYAARLDSTSGRLDVSDISAFVTDHALVTVRRSTWWGMDDVIDRWDAAPELTEHGAAGLLYPLLDAVVDGHFDAVQQLDDGIEDLEDQLFDERQQTKDAQHRTYTLRRSLVQLRRVVLPMREVLNVLMRRDNHRIPAELFPSYQDVYDHVLRASEWTDSLRDMVTALFETNLSLNDQRMNLVMKKLTGWAAIIAVPTAITSFYGQNLPFPGYGTPWGFAVSIGLIVVIALVLYAVFRRKDWL